MIHGNTSDLVVCIETKKVPAVANTPSVEVTVVDGAAVVHFFSDWGGLQGTGKHSDEIMTIS